MKQIITTLFVALLLFSGCQTCPKKDCGKSEAAKKPPCHSAGDEQKKEQTVTRILPIAKLWGTPQAPAVHVRSAPNRCRTNIGHRQFYAWELGERGH